MWSRHIAFGNGMLFLHACIHLHCVSPLWQNGNHGSPYLFLPYHPRWMVVIWPYDYSQMFGFASSDYIYQLQFQSSCSQSRFHISLILIPLLRSCTCTCMSNWLCGYPFSSQVQLFRLWCNQCDRTSIHGGLQHTCILSQDFVNVFFYSNMDSQVHADQYNWE